MSSSGSGSGGGAPKGRGRGRSGRPDGSDGSTPSTPGGSRASTTPAGRRDEPSAADVSRQQTIGRVGRQDGGAAAASPTVAGPAAGASAAGGNGKPQRGSPPSGHSPTERMAGLELIGLARRPGFGQMGRKYRMFTNHFEVGIRGKLLTVNQYHIDVTHPKIKLTRDDNRSVFWKCINQFRNELGLQANDALYSVAYDGVHICYTLDPLNVPHEKNNDSRKFQVEQVVSKTDRIVTLDVLVQQVGPLAVDFSQVVSPTLQDRKMTPIQVIDILLRQFRSQPYLESSKLFYPFRNSIFMIPGLGNTAGGLDLGSGREVWRGLFTSAHVAEGNRPLINMDVDHSAFYKFMSGNGRNANGQNGHYTVIQFMCDVLNEAERRQLYFPRDINAQTVIPDQQKKLFEKEIRGLKVCVDYKKAKSVNDSREHRVTGVDKSAIEATFTDREGKVVKVAEYYRDTYGELKYPRLFTLNVGGKNKPINLPVEHCYLARNQKVTKKLSEVAVSTMIKQTCMAPVARKTAIQDVVNQARFNEDPFLNKFGVQVNPNMLQIEGRRLPDPAFKYASGQINPRDGVWNTRGQKFFKAAGAEAIAVVAFQRPPNGAEQFVNSLFQTCRSLGMQMPGNEQIFYHVESNNGTQRAEIAIRAVSEKMKNVSLILVMLPFKGANLYADIKRAAEITFGIMTQCVLGKTVERASPDTLTNIALKINMKLGGINCSLEAREAALKFLLNPASPTLVLGIDVTHPGPTEKKKPSVASIVGSMDFSQMRYGASIKVQAKRDEHLVYLADKVTERLMAFYKATQKKPDRVIVYRDGVSEGQFQQVLREELRGVKEACSKVDATYKPKITFIVVQKRHHTRFFPADPNDGCGKAKNVYPGTCVDTRIVNPGEFVFYLCSHAGIQGTSRPSRYYVLHDDSDFSADDIQMITYYLCHCFSRCTRSVKVPAPVYYADLACTRARAHLSSAIGDSLSDTTSTQSGGHESSSSPKEDELIAATSVHELVKREMYFT